MAKNAKQSTKKKVDWKKVLTLVVVIVLIVLKLLYGDSEGDESASGQNSGNVVESSQSVDDTLASNYSANSTVAEDGQSTGSVVAESNSAGVESESAEPEIPDLSFRSEYLLNQHYEKHGIDMGFASAEEYEAAACRVIANSETLHKLEAEDGDDVYYLESTNEFVVVSKDGYLRTYFLPDDGIEYYNRQ